ncbi:MipA/OmpV family protein [Oxalobacteraceae bacterium OM1]|nr:MipA/OmpV family protein [Oxalobacteraceae bacterium OM1]
MPPIRYLPAAFLFVSCAVSAADLPLWEVGLGAAAISLPDYRGADTRTNRVLPAPYFVYRGERLRADRNGIRTEMFETDRASLELSLNATLARSGTDTPARRGMESLRPLVEFGPALNLHVWRAGGTALDLRLPVRTAYTVQSSPRHAGWLFAPNLLLRSDRVPGLAGWRGSVQAGPQFATRAYHDYVYSVGTTEALPDRPAYAAPGGYSGMQATVTLSKRFANAWAGAYVRQDWLRGAAFIDSPLVRQQAGTTAGIAVAWILGTSQRNAAAGDTVD